MSTSEAYLREVELPSRGLFYGSSIPNGKITIKPMGAKQEKLFSAGANNANAIISKIFDDCIQSPIPHADLVLGDRMHLLWQLRAISYGDSYAHSFACSNCNKQTTRFQSIAALPVKWADPKSSGKFEVKLPVQGHVLEFRLLTGKDEEKVEQYMKQITARNGGKPTGDDYTFRLARRIESVDGVKIPIKDAMDLVDSLAGDDNIAFRDALEDADVGPSMMIEDAACDHCGFIQDPFPLPITTEFFRPRRRGSVSDKNPRDAVLPPND